MTLRTRRADELCCSCGVLRICVMLPPGEACRASWRLEQVARAVHLMVARKQRKSQAGKGRARCVLHRWRWPQGHIWYFGCYRRFGLSSQPWAPNMNITHTGQWWEARRPRKEVLGCHKVPTQLWFPNAVFHIWICSWLPKKPCFPNTLGLSIWLSAILFLWDSSLPPLSSQPQEFLFIPFILIQSLHWYCDG